MMDIETKTKLTGFLKYIMKFANWNGVDDIYFMCDIVANEKMENFRQLRNLNKQYNFFNGLSRQTELDNIISLMRICDRLDVDMPQLQINLENIEETYDLIWKGINEQVPMSDDVAMEIVNIAHKTIEMEDDLREYLNGDTVDNVIEKCYDTIELEI